MRVRLPFLYILHLLSHMTCCFNKRFPFNTQWGVENILVFFPSFLEKEMVEEGEKNY